MGAELDAATERVIATRARLTGLPDCELSEQEIKDALCEGYAYALDGDACLIALERRLHELIDDGSPDVCARDLRDLAAERSQIERCLIGLRDELAALRAERDRLRARSSAP